jgi:hypothetical protein
MSAGWDTEILRVELESLQEKTRAQGLKALGSIPILSFTADAIRWVQPR